jgi:lipopolysaccharide/colanic/teichoic acid biosynthesis glycosyltransferase
LPQLINVLKGDISFVGNRPLPRRNVSPHIDGSSFMQRFDSPAGMAGIAQLSGRSDRLDQRSKLENHYSFLYNSNRSILLVDIKILYYTFQKIFFGRSYSSKYLLDKFSE